MSKYITIESSKDNSKDSNNKEEMVTVTRMEKEVEFHKKEIMRTLEHELRADYMNYQSLDENKESDKIAKMLLRNVFRKLNKITKTNFKL
jgi:hypothetical protein